MSAVRSARRDLGSWVAVAAAPLAWFAHLNVSYLLVPVACDRGTWLLHLATLAAAAVAGSSGWFGWRAWRTSGTLVGAAAVLFGGLFLATIVVMGMANVVVDPCRQ